MRRHPAAIPYFVAGVERQFDVVQRAMLYGSLGWKLAACAVTRAESYGAVTCGWKLSPKGRPRRTSICTAWRQVGVPESGGKNTPSAVGIAVSEAMPPGTIAGFNRVRRHRREHRAAPQVLADRIAKRSPMSTTRITLGVTFN